MGCDIHFTVEQRGPDGLWHRAEEMVPNPWFDRGYEDEPEFEREEWYTGRNYTLFAVLAGVRGSVRPIANPRGIPSDLAPETDRDGDLGDHSFSWLTLRELLGYPSWDKHADDTFFVVLKRLQALPGADPDSVRIVFGFDS